MLARAAVGAVDARAVTRDGVLQRKTAKMNEVR